MSSASSSRQIFAVRSFSRKILMVMSLVLLVALLGSSIGFWSLYRGSQQTHHMVDDLLQTERMTSELQQHILLNVARAKALALSSEPQVGDALNPDIAQTSAQVASLLDQLGKTLKNPDDRAILQRMQDTNASFVTARMALTQARDAGVTDTITKVLTERFQPAATQLQAAVMRLGDSQRAKIDASARSYQ